MGASVKRKCLWCEDPIESGDYCDDLCERLHRYRHQKSFTIVSAVDKVEQDRQKAAVTRRRNRIAGGGAQNGSDSNWSD